MNVAKVPVAIPPLVVIATLVLAAVPFAGVARAEPAPADIAVARSLFFEARKLMGEGRWADACPKLEESEHIDPGIGTEFNLADCYEHTGRLASAWALFEQVAATARQTNQTAHAALAQQRGEAVAPRVPVLVVEVPAGSRAEGLEITRDGAPVPAAVLSTPVRVDVGEHVVVAHAPNRVPWTVTVQLGEGGSTTVRIPDLEAATPSSPPPDVPAPARGLSGRKTVGLALGAVGLGAVVAGTVFGAVSWSAHGDAKQWCDATTNACTDPRGVDARSNAVHYGNASSGLFVGGGALLGAGVLVWLTAPASNARVDVRPTPSGIVAAGRF
jgi:hypothetical protein